MTRNQKIALGCGGAGCLGLIVVAIAACAIYFLVYRTPAYRAAREYNLNVNLSNSNSNENSNTNANANDNSNSNSTGNENANATSGTSVSSMSDDDKHRLYYAAALTGDTELINRVNVKLGILNDDFTPGEHFQQFMADHYRWIIQNTAFTRTIDSQEKARAYVNEHFPE